MTDNAQHLRWQGAHPIALTTRDLDATVRFYHGLLEMPLVGAKGAMPHHGPHVFFNAGGFLVHFFGQPDNEVAPVPSGWSREFSILPGFFQHLALAVASEDDLVALRERLLAAGVEVTDLKNQGPVRQFLFADNNGIVWEVNWSSVDLARLPTEQRDALLFTDPDPGPAVRDIREGRMFSS